MEVNMQINQIILNGEKINSVNSREVYQHLGVDTKYSDWIKRAIDKYEFVENEDFQLLKNEKSNSNNPMMDYIVTLDMAKELCMVSNTPRGKETRKYFIQAEKQLSKQINILQNPMDALSLFFEVNQEQDKRISKLEDTKRLENWQEKSLQDAKNRKVYEIAKDDKLLASKLHRKVWSLFKKQFHLPRYNELPSIKYEDGLSYINNLTFADMVS